MKTLELDCVGLCCPMPLVRVKRAMDTLMAGDCLSVTASDLAFEADIKAWSAKFGHPILELNVGSHVKAILQKAA